MQTQRVQSNASRASLRTRWVRWLVVVGLLATPLAQAQQDPEESSSQESPSSQRPESSLPERPSPVNGETGELLAKTLSPLSWGRLSLISFSMLGVRESQFQFADQGATPTYSMMMRGHLVYRLGRSWAGMTLQYRPRVLVAQRRRDADFAAHSLDFDSHRYLTLSRRWVLSVSDNLNYAPDRERLIDPTFRPNFETGGSIYTPFLAHGRRAFTNSVTVTTEYTASPRDRLEFSVNHALAFLEADPAISLATSGVQKSHTLGGGVHWRHKWTANAETGLSYHYDRGFLSGVLAVSPGVQFHNFLFHYGHQFGTSVRMGIDFGPTWSIRRGGGETRTYQGSAHLFKSFRNSRLALTYVRSHDFSGVISDHFHDRVDVSYAQGFGQRWNVAVGGGYLLQGRSQGSRLRGALGWVSWGYRLSRTWTAFASYSYFDVVGFAPAFGARRTVSAGLRWHWDPDFDLD